MNRKTFLTTIAAIVSAPFIKRKPTLTEDQKNAIMAGVALIALGAKLQETAVITGQFKSKQSEIIAHFASEFKKVGIKTISDAHS